MAARKASREDKSVLSRQDIAERRRKLTQKKRETGGAGRKALAGIAVLTASLMALVGLTTYHVRDRVGPSYQNAIGPVGHAIAECLKGALGVCAYVVPIAGLYLAGVLFVGVRGKRRWPLLAAGAMLLVSISTLAQLLSHPEPHAAFPPGGALGETLAITLGGMVSVVGTLLLMVALTIAALIVGTQLAFMHVCAVAGHAIAKLVTEARERLLVFVAKQREAFGRQREARAQAKLEEAAFLAQLEADEEALQEAERDVDEADAMAEEAYRLAQEADVRGAQRDQEKRDKLAAKVGRLPSKERPNLPALPADASLAHDTLPPGDPAWASAYAVPPTVAAAATAAAMGTLASEASARRRDKKGGTGLPSLPNALAEFSPATEAPPAPSSGMAVSPSTALARMPLIVEPKAPPAPTLPGKREEFEFAAGHTRFTLPPLSVLDSNKVERSELDKDAFLATAAKLCAKLADFGIDGEVVEIRPGPVVTMYEFLPGPGIKVSKIAGLQDDLAMAMEAMRVRIVAPIPGKGVVGIEVPNRDRETVYLKEIVEQDVFQKAVSRITMCVGKDIEGMPYVLDLAKAPHLLIAGTTGSGKSVAVNAMIMSMLLKATPEEVRFIMVDPKMLELSVYEGIPHLLLPVVTDPKKAALALRWAVEEMERRYHLLSEAGVRNISGYNKLVEAAEAEVKTSLVTKSARVGNKKSATQKAAKRMLIVDVAADESESAGPSREQNGATLGVAAPREDFEDLREALPPSEETVESSAFEADEEDGELEYDASDDSEEADAPEKKEVKKLPYIVVIIDELADLMMVASREVETYIARLAQMARAAGIHLMVATQRPSTDVVTGIIKANFPTRVSFMLRTKPDSMTILGTVGAEALLGMGDMLIMPATSSHMQRVHGAYVSEQEIKRAVDHLKAQGKPVYDDSILKAREEDGEGAAVEDELSDELYDQALATVCEMQNISISMLQRKMRIGYNRAARMIERMERDGVVGPADGAKPREVRLKPVGEMTA